MPKLCGANGEQEFQKICDINSSAPESSCKPGKHPSHRLVSRARYKNSVGITVSCQASVQTYHNLRLGGHPHTFNMDAHQYLHVTRILGDARSRRLVRMDRYNPTSANTDVSYIRSWIGFRN